MKVILLQHVKKVGKKHDIVDVSPGYAQNALFPQKLATPATEIALAKLRAEQKTANVRNEKAENAIKQALQSLHKQTIEIPEKTNEKGGLYKALDTESIANILSQKTGTTITADVVQSDAIKESGQHEIALAAFGEQVSVTLDIQPMK